MARRWSDRRVRAIAWQALAVVAVAALVGYIGANVAANLKSRGVASGFGFFDATAGFQIGVTLIPYSASSTYGRAFLVGLLNTLLVSAIAIVFATLIGFALGLARLSSNWLVARLAGTYVEVIRNIPLLLQIYFWYFAVLRTLPGPRQSIDMIGLGFLNNRGLYIPAPVLGDGAGWAVLEFAAAIALAVAVTTLGRRTEQRWAGGWAPLAAVVAVTLLAAVAAGFSVPWEWPERRGFNYVGGSVLTPELLALVVALSTYTASFIAENVRGGVLSVGRGQSEAALALGLTRGQALRFVVVPQALRVIIPPLASQYLNLVKNSSLAAAIAYPDLVSVFAGTVLNQTGQAIEIIFVTMAVYLAISLVIALALNLYNRRIMRTQAA